MITDDGNDDDDGNDYDRFSDLFVFYFLLAATIPTTVLERTTDCENQIQQINSNV